MGFGGLLLACRRSRFWLHHLSPTFDEIDRFSVLSFFTAKGRERTLESARGQYVRRTYYVRRISTLFRQPQNLKTRMASMQSSLRLLNARIAELSLRSSASSALSRCPLNGAREWRTPLTARVFSSRTNTTRLRTHAVSLYHGDYSDPEDGGDENKEAFGYYENTEEDELADSARKEQEEYERKKAKWIENAKPHVRVPIIDERGRSYGRGGRKTASARVWIQPGFGNVVVNRKDFIDYFERAADREQILSPFVATRTCGVFDVQCMVQGGGLSGQAGAIRHGLARALNNWNPDEYRPPLKRLGYLARDPRKVERKKVGKVKARKSPQWARR